MSEAERHARIVSDMTKHVSDEVLEVIKRHSMTMETAGQAASMAALVGATAMIQAAQFAVRSGCQAQLSDAEVASLYHATLKMGLDWVEHERVTAFGESLADGRLMHGQP